MTTGLEVLTYIITHITVSLIGRAAILVIMNVMTFKIDDAIIFIGNTIMCFTSH